MNNFRGREFFHKRALLNRQRPGDDDDDDDEEDGPIFPTLFPTRTSTEETSTTRAPPVTQDPETSTTRGQAEPTTTTRTTPTIPTISIPSEILPPTTATSVTTTSSSSSRVTSSSSSSTPSSTSSSTSSSVLSTSSSSSLTTSATTSSVRPVSSSTRFVTSTAANAAASASASASQSAEPSGATSTGTIIGIVIGSLAGVGALVIIVGYIVRRFRRRQQEKDIFDAQQFRSSAVLLDDDASMFDPGRGSGGYGATGMSAPGFVTNSNYDAHLRPPTMIERHMAHGSSFGPQGGMSQDYPGQYSNFDMVTPAMPQQAFTPEDSGVAGAGAYLNRQPSGGAQYLERQPTMSSNDHSAYLQRQPTYTEHQMAPSAGYAPVSVPSPAPFLPPVTTVRSPSPPSGPSLPPPAALIPGQVAPAPAPPQQGGLRPDAGNNANARRPESVVSTMYNPDDAYGGM